MRCWTPLEGAPAPLGRPAPDLSRLETFRSSRPSARNTSRSPGPTASGCSRYSSSPNPNLTREVELRPLPSGTGGAAPRGQRRAGRTERKWVRAQGRWGAGALAGRSACCQQTTRVPGRRRSPGVVGLPKLIGRSGSTDSWIATGCPVLTAVRPEIGAQPRDLERPSDRVARPKAPR